MLELYSAATPNGWKATVLLEELQLPYTLTPIDLGSNAQKEAWFLKINPNGRIPALIDHGEDDFAVFESGAIMIYLAEKAGKLLGNNAKEKSQVIQWLMFQMGGIGPMMGQANVFFRYFPEKIQPAIDRYQNEGRRLLTVLDSALAERDYLVGENRGEYSVADIANWCWAHTYEWSGIDISGLDNLQAWIQRIRERPAVQAGIRLPVRGDKDTVTQTGQTIIQK
ncbi:glutathione S-transferase family protein [Thalassolituus oleivorans]|uniref:glutathione S-transferase family protein n=1 Tax=Thalassolituus oleivorans TaxID=187493 RepID=UPI0023F3AEAB|nr:glutathione S-transferase N-terminal domain-containing protein [Thalassolituus oleivorans]